MRVVRSWLQELLDLDDISAQDLAEVLTSLGLQVEKIHHPGEDLEGLLAVKIKSVIPHPGADDLWLCSVYDGQRTHQVVSGATNLHQGMMVPWAPPGSLLPTGQAVSRKEIRGEVSQGMMLSAQEVGWGEAMSEIEGIWELDPGVRPGDALAEALELDDVVLELDLTPNYASHCQSLLGVARELSAYLGRPLSCPEPAEEKADGPGQVEISILEPRLCPRYTGQVITGVGIIPSPWWMKRRLVLSGIRPHNSVVDVTNYVMLELGQPLHAFDLDQLRGGEIRVRRAQAGESLTTLDGKRRELSPDDLVIADADRPVALAGIMGGLDTEVGSDSESILLEAASFSSLAIRKSATRLGLRTDASSRFEKGLDPHGTIPAIRRAASLMSQIMGSRVGSPLVDVMPREIEPSLITFRPGLVRRLLGTEVEAGEITGILARLGFEVKEGQESLEVTVPSWRGDVSAEVDLVEEVARHHGYDQIPETVPEGRVSSPSMSRQRLLKSRFRRLLLGTGLSEVVTYAFASHEEMERLGIEEDHSTRDMLAIENPLGAWQEGLRTLLFPGLLRCLAHNQARQNEDIALFEQGKVYLPQGNQESDLPREAWRLALLLAGRWDLQHWNQKARAADFFDLKGVVETLLQRMGPGDHSFEPWTAPWLHPGRGAMLVSGNTVLGWLGELHPEVSEAFSLGGRVLVSELDLDSWWDLVSYPGSFQQWGRFPSVSRDLALVVEEGTRAQEVTRCIEKAGIPLLEEADLFDVYRGEQVDPGCKSLAYSLTYRSETRTLTDDEVEEVHQRIRRALEEDLGARLRS